MATQAQDNFSSGTGRGASNAAGSLSAGQTVTAWSPGSNGNNWIVQTAPSAYSYNSGTTQGQTTGATTVNIVTLNGVDSLSNPQQWYDSIVTARFQKTASGDACGVVARCTDANHYYRASVTNNQLQIVKNVNGSFTTLATYNFTDAGAQFHVKLGCRGFGFNGATGVQNIQAKVWADGSTEPGWQIGVNDSDLTSVGYVGIHMKGAATGNTQSVDSFKSTDPVQPVATPAYNATKDSPYGVTVYVGNSAQIITQQEITDLLSWGNGVWDRRQYKWTQVETAQGIYNWAAIDDWVYRSNQAGIKTCWNIQSPPSWRQTLDIYGNDSTLGGAGMTHGTGYTSIPVSALRTGAMIPHQAQYSVDYGTGNAETFYIWNPGSTFYQAGATSIQISSTKNSLTAFTPLHDHAAGAKLVEATKGYNYANATDFTTIAQLAAQRYNGAAGFGKLDIIQIENEDYDAAAWIGNQGPGWDVGGSVLAPVYKACRDAILAAYPGVTVIPCAVRKTPTLAVAHIQNWLTYLIQGVQRLGGTIDGMDFHYYRATSNYDNLISLDPTQSTYTDSSLTTVNTPSIALEISTIQAVFATYGLTGKQINCWECGWDGYDDGNGVVTTLTAARNAGTAYTTLPVAALPSAISDTSPVYLDYNNTGLAEGGGIPPTVTGLYAYGTAASGATTIQITTNPRGSAVAQASYTPTNTHAINSQVYGGTTANPTTQALQSQWIQAMFDAMRTAGATRCFVFTDNVTATVTSTVYPNSSTSPKSITQTISGTYTYLQAYNDIVAYIGVYPSWVPSGGGPPVVIPNWTVYIGGTTPFVIAGSLIINSSIGRRSQLQCLIYQPGTTASSYVPRLFGGTLIKQVSAPVATHYQQYQQVQVRDPTGALVFSGYISSPDESKPGFQMALETKIVAIDQHFCADKRIVATVYRNFTCGAIVTDMLNSILSAEGVVAGTIAPGPIVPYANFGYVKVSAALDAIVAAASAQGVQYYWTIDQNKALQFVPYTAITGPTVDGTQIDSGQRSGFVPHVVRANPKYRNTEYVTGGVEQTGTNDETRQGDGQTRAFTYSYPLAAAPTTFTLNGASKSLGIKGQTGYNYYYAIGDPVIAQDSSQPVLVSTDRLRMVYVGQIPTTFSANYAAQIAAQAAIDGTSGIIEDVLEDKTITTAADGLARANQQLTQYGISGLLFEFATMQTSFQAGQLITVTYAPYGFSNTQMLIETVDMSDQQDGHNVWYTIHAIAGPYDVGWVQFFSNWIQPTTIASNINLGTTLNIGLAPSTTLAPATTLPPG